MKTTLVQIKTAFNPRSGFSWEADDATFYATGMAEGFVEPEESDNVIEAWAYLIYKGICWRLQGFFGRSAQSLIDHGIVSSEGEINWELVDELQSN